MARAPAPPDGGPVVDTGGATDIGRAAADRAADPPSSFEVAVLRAELRWLRARMDDLATAVGHDLRGPIAVISGHAQLLEGSPGASPQVLRSASALRRQSDRLVEMMDGLHARLRTLTALDDGGLPFGGERLDGQAPAEDAVRSAVALLGPLAARRGVRVDVRFDGVGLVNSARGLRAAAALLLEVAILRARSGEAVLVEGVAGEAEVALEIGPGDGATPGHEPRGEGSDLLRAAGALADALGGRVEVGSSGPLRLLLPAGGDPPVCFVGPEDEVGVLAARLGLPARPVPPPEVPGALSGAGGAAPTPVTVVAPAAAPAWAAANLDAAGWHVVVAPRTLPLTGGARRWVVPELGGTPALRAAVQDARRAAARGSARRDPATGLIRAHVHRGEILDRVGAAAHGGGPAVFLLVTVANVGELSEALGTSGMLLAIRWIASLIGAECPSVPEPMGLPGGALLLEAPGWTRDQGEACAQRLQAVVAAARPRFGALRVAVRVRAIARDASTLEDRQWLVSLLATGEGERE